MTWIIILTIVVVSALKILITCLPTPIVNWIVAKFEIHSKIELNAKVTIEGVEVKGESKKEIINIFNRATFLERYYIHPGNEHIFLHPQQEGKMLVINIKSKKYNVEILVYKQKGQVVVVKHYRKKLIAYSLLSKELQSIF
ncbi:YfmQ family protein [Priestia aryabhattai]